MATSAKRAFKIQEFAAHGGNVICAALGHDSGRVIVSGGEDRKVNLWAVGKSNCILSLSGHTSPVEAVRFRPDEKAVIAGSLSGTVKIWDLESVKILRTMSGHKSAVRCIDYHPFNDYLLTGSLDSNIKVWDMRRKTCLYTYSGHTNCVNCIRFSPDAQWMASAGEDGTIKIWDMTAGKQLAVFRNHTGPVNCIQFHPNDLLLASGSSDRTVMFWDLESMQLIGSSDGESTPVRSLLFHPKEECLYSAGIDHLKVYGWEPSRIFDSITIGWGRPADIAMVDTQMVGVSFSQQNLSTFAVDIQKVQPLGGEPYQQSMSNPPRMAVSSSVHRRRSFMSERLATQCDSLKFKGTEDEDVQISAADDDDDNASIVEINDMTEYKQVFQPKHELPRGPPLLLPTKSQENKKSPSVNVNKQNQRPTVQRTNPEQSSETNKDSSTMSSTSVASNSRTKRPPTSCTGGRSSRNNGETNAKENTKVKTKRSVPDDVTFEIKSRMNRPSSEDQRSIKDRSASHSEEDSKKFPPFEDQDVLPNRFQIRDELAKNVRPSKADQTSNYKNISNRPDVDDFLPKPILSSGDIDENTAGVSISSGHDAIMAVMSARHRNLQVIKAMWTAGNIKTSVDAAVGMNDPAVLHDVVNMMLQKSSVWTLDHCNSLLPLLVDLISSKYESYNNAGLNGVKLILRNFATIIKANITAPPLVGVDISREERASKCLACYKELMKIRSELDQKFISGQFNAQRAPHYKEIQLLMNQLD